MRIHLKINYMIFFLLIIGLLNVASLTCAEAPIRPVTKELPQVSELPPLGNDSMRALEDLVVVTEKHLKAQNMLKAMLKDYLQVRERYLANMDDDRLAIKMVDLGNKISILIAENHLTYLFDQELLNELNVCAKITNRK